MNVILEHLSALGLQLSGAFFSREDMHADIKRECVSTKAFRARAPGKSGTGLNRSNRSNDRLTRSKIAKTDFS